MTERFERELYRPIRPTVDWPSRHAQRLRSCSVNHYVVYVFAIVLMERMPRLL